MSQLWTGFLQNCQRRHFCELGHIGGMRQALLICLRHLVDLRPGQLACFPRYLLDHLALALKLLPCLQAPKAVSMNFCQQTYAVPMLSTRYCVS